MIAFPEGPLQPQQSFLQFGAVCALEVVHVATCLDTVHTYVIKRASINHEEVPTTNFF